MKYLKTYENKETDEIFKLFQELKFHDEKHREIDKKIANICIKKLEIALTQDDLSSFDIKKIYYNFYKDIYSQDPEDRGQTIVFSFEKDLVLMWLNKELKKREEQQKYNL